MFEISFDLCLLALVFGAFALLDRRLEDVAERGARVRRSVRRDGLLLFGDLECLDRNRDAPCRLVDGDDGRIDLVADVVAFRALLGAVTRKVAALDECRQLAVGDLDLDAGLAALTSRCM